MASTKTIQRSFAGGEVSPAMFGRSDDVKYQTGLEVCKNFLCRPQGPIENRPGFQYVNEVKDSTKRVRIIPFTWNTTQTFVIELGDKYARFHTQGHTLMNEEGTAPYEVETPWAEEDLFDLTYVQSNDVVTVVHEKYAPHEIRRNSSTNWSVVKINFGSTLSTPSNVHATRNSETADDPNAENYTFQYKVSALNEDKTIESAPSGAVSCTANLYASGTTIKVSWNAVSGASFYRIYKNQGGVFGFIGDAEGTSIIDDNIAPMTDVTPRRQDKIMVSDSYPSAVGYFEQRRWFGGFSKDPQRVIATRSGTESDMTYSLPSMDDDRINFRIAATEFNKIEHIVPISQLIILTSGSEMRVSPQNSDAITPSSISVRPQSYIGTSRVKPVVANNNIVFCSSRDGHIRELAYQYNAGGYVSGDLCLRSQHLFDYKTIKDSAFSKSPYPVIWFVSSDGSLLGLTYIPEQQIGSWHHHTTLGEFESVAAISEGVEDHLYAVIKRTINGETKRYIERMTSRNFGELPDAVFVDCAGTYRGAETQTVSGISWLEGETVAILADGAVVPEQKVVGGKITLPAPAKVVHIGLPYTADAKTLPLIIGDQALGQGRNKNVSRISVKTYQATGVFAGPSFDTGDLVEYKQRTTEQPGSPPAMINGDIDIVLFPSWSDSGSICVRQADPLPITLLSLACDVSV